jgi:hypothetical protein
LEIDLMTFLENERTTSDCCGVNHFVALSAPRQFLNIASKL